MANNTIPPNTDLAKIDLTAFQWKKFPTTFPSIQPVTPPSYGGVSPGYTDVGSDATVEARKRILNRSDRVTIAGALVNALNRKYPGAYGASPYGEVNPETGQFIRPVPQTGAPLFGFGGSLSFPGMTTGQTVFIVILGILLLIGITKR